MFKIFLSRLTQIMARDHEVWIAGQRYIRYSQVEEAVRHAEKKAPEIPPQRIVAEEDLREFIKENAATVRMWLGLEKPSVEAVTL